MYFVKILSMESKISLTPEFGTAILPVKLRGKPDLRPGSRFIPTRRNQIMKKAIVLLLALTIIGGAVFAQATVAVSLSGKVVLVNQDGEGMFAPNGSGYDLLTIKASKDNYGFSIVDSNILNGFEAVRDWNVYYKMFDDMAKFTFGNLRDGAIRMTLPNWYYGNFLGATDRISGYGLLSNLYPMDGLNIGVNLPYGLTAEPVVDVLKKIDLGAKYVIADMGTLIALANLNLVTESNIFNFGFTYSGMEALTATVLYKGTFATAATHAFAVGVAYDVMEALSVGVEFDGAYTTALAWEVAGGASYTVTEAISVDVVGMYADDASYDASATLTYDLGAGFELAGNAGYDGTFYAALTAGYSVSF